MDPSRLGCTINFIKVKVEGIEEIPKLVMCLMCEEEPAVVTMSPCNHQFCMGRSRPFFGCHVQSSRRLRKNK